jgi:hypothetical protein
VLAKYNPIAQLEVVEGTNATSAANLNFAPDYDKTARDIEASMGERLGDEPLVEIQSISISYIGLSETTQKKLDDFIAAVGDTRIAAQRKSTAAEEKAANDILASSVKNPNVLASKCLDIMTAGIEAKYAFPAGWTCSTDGSSAVVVPSGR